MTLAAAFKKVYAERLAKYGFKKIKSKYPYYVRVVNDEILQVITFKNDAKFDFYSNYFVVWGGIATIYRKEILLDESVANNSEWLDNTAIMFKKANRTVVRHYDYLKENDESLIEAMERSYADIEEVMLPIFDEIDSLEKCYHFIAEMVPSSLSLSAEDKHLEYIGVSGCHESLMSIVTYGESGFEEYKRLNLERLSKYIDRQMHRMNDKWYERDLMRMKNIIYKNIESFNTYITDPKWKEKVDNEIAKRKEDNTENLKRWGLI